MSWIDRLADPARLLRALERIAANRGARGVDALAHDGVPLRVLLLERGRFARLLAAAVRARAYAPAPARVRRVRLDKERDLYAFRAGDLVLHGAFAELLTEAMEPQLSPRLFSYRRGRSALDAVAELGAYARAHARAEPEARRRGLYVYHCDVRSYGESIPLHDGAPLWAELRALLGDADDAAWRLAGALVRPEVEGAGRPALGVATGSPIATALTNLYLAPVDRALEGLPFYARYGDDLLVAAPDAATARAAEATIDELLAARGLEINPRKRQLIYFTGCGRRSADEPRAAGAARVLFLGLEVALDGAVSLPPRKERELLRDLRGRVTRTARLLPPGERGPALGAVLARALDARSPFCTPLAQLLLGAVTDRGRLRHLDNLLALAVSEAATGRRGVRAFRDAAPRLMRRAWGVPSLVELRNRR